MGYITIENNVIRGNRDVAIALQGSPSVSEGPASVSGNDIRDAITHIYVSSWENVSIPRDRKKKRRKR